MMQALPGTAAGRMAALPGVAGAVGREGRAVRSLILPGYVWLTPLFAIREMRLAETAKWRREVAEEAGGGYERRFGDDRRGLPPHFLRGSERDGRQRRLGVGEETNVDSPSAPRERPGALRHSGRPVNMR